MKLLQYILSPIARDYWIGRTFLHRNETGVSDPVAPQIAGLRLNALCSEDMAEIHRSPNADLRRYGAGAPGLRQFGARIDGEIAAVCTFSSGEEYARAGGFYLLDRNEAELTDIFTSTRYRGRGIAGALIRFSTGCMHNEGFHTLYAKVWHSNTPSSRAFLGAGWKQSCFFVRLSPRGRSGHWHMEWPRP